TVGAKFAKTSGPEGGGVTSFLVSGTSVFAGARGGVLLSTNNGRSWTELGEGLPADKDVLSLAVSGAKLFARTGGVGTSSGAGIYRSTDQGQSWMAVNTGLPVNEDVSSLAVSGANLFAAVGVTSNFSFSYRVFRSTNQGESWTDISVGLPTDHRV